ncbi:MAG: hypothetical protein ACP5TL_00380 [Candidatus Micrarchaeia archaeon]
MRFLYLLLIATLFGYAFASTTVTLSGSCQNLQINSSNPYLFFRLSNEGNGVASSVIVEPLFNGFSTYNGSFGINQLEPNSTYEFYFKLYNFSENGSFVEPIIVDYQQGSSSFAALFPCVVSVGKPTHSLLEVSSSQFKSGILNVTLINIANYTIKGTVAVYASPSFKVKPARENVSVGPFATVSEYFNISLPHYSNATIPVSVSAYYSRDGLHYSTLAVIPIVMSGAKSDLKELTIIAVSAIIIAILLLIVISIYKSWKEKHLKEDVSNAKN